MQDYYTTDTDPSLVVKGTAYFMTHTYVTSTKMDGVRMTDQQAMLSDNAEQ